MKIDYEKQVTSLLEQMEIDATCPDCGKLSLAIWGATGTCPYCTNAAQTSPGVHCSESEAIVSI
jgi:hypothetical protein